jgi:DNA-binding transcriptional ArsR family regulator
LELAIGMKKARTVQSKTARGTQPAAATRQPQPAKPAARTSSGTQAAGLPEPPRGRWTFLTNHSHVLILLSHNPSIVLREVASRVGITERAVQRIIADLEEEGFIEREKVGRQNRYRILADRPLRHSIEAHRTIGDLVGLIDKTP